MEVHHHAHPPEAGPGPAGAGHRKKWTHYFWEFLMLFLAVFCGFLAEYQLEHKIEKDRAKELAKSFYEELKNDSAVVSQKNEARIKSEKAFIWLANYFKDSSLTNLSKDFELNFLYGIYFRTPTVFEPRTIVLEQLKNSGSLRYFKSEELQRLVGDLSVAIQNINDRQALEFQVRLQYLNPIIIRHHDYDFEDELTDKGTIDIFTAIAVYESTDRFIPFHFNSPQKFDKQEMVNIMNFYGRAGVGSTRRVHFKKYIEVNAAVLKALRKEYRLK